MCWLMQISVALMSLHAASTRLNIAFANHVILMDNWWNPTTMDQAVDRCHQIGQTKVVWVHRLEMGGTIEQNVFALQQRKRKIIRQIYSYRKSEPQTVNLDSKVGDDLDWVFNKHRNTHGGFERDAEYDYESE